MVLLSIAGTLKWVAELKHAALGCREMGVIVVRYLGRPLRSDPRAFKRCDGQGHISLSSSAGLRLGEEYLAPSTVKTSASSMKILILSSLRARIAGPIGLWSTTGCGSSSLATFWMWDLAMGSGPTHSLVAGVIFTPSGCIRFSNRLSETCQQERILLAALGRSRFATGAR